jgi:hypothetical protein
MKLLRYHSLFFSAKPVGTFGSCHIAEFCPMFRIGQKKHPTIVEDTLVLNRR